MTGETLTLADFAIAAPLCLARQAQLPLEPYRAIQRWQADIQALPAWSKTLAMQG